MLSPPAEEVGDSASHCVADVLQCINRLHDQGTQAEMEDDQHMDAMLSSCCPM